MRKYFVFFLFFLFISISSASSNDTEIRTRVSSVYDGDTFTVTIDEQEEKVRVIGIDAPEIKKGDKKFCRGKIVAALAKKLLENQEVLLIRDKKTENRDSFGRLLRYIKIREKLDYGFFLILLGNAEIYEKEDFSKKDFYKKFQEKAKRYKRGIWSKKCILENAPTESSNEVSSTEKGNENSDIGSDIRRDGDFVKKSKTGICHDENSQYFKQTKAYRWYSTVEACLDSGGRLPK